MATAGLALLPLYLETSSEMPSLRMMPMPASSVQRWDGNTRVATEWNSLRRDNELWFDDGQCYVYLYRPGQSQRGPSFRLPYHLLAGAGCQNFLDNNLISTWNSSPFQSSVPEGECYLYLHAPADLSLEDAFKYHVDTRNFFAWMVGAPLVGTDPVAALVGLKDRLEQWRDAPSDNLEALIAYIKEQGYCDVPVEAVSFGYDVQPKLPSTRERRLSIRSMLRGPLRAAQSLDAVRLAKRRLSTSSPMNAPVPLSRHQSIVVPQYGTGMEHRRLSDSSSNDTPPSLTHSREASTSSSASMTSDYDSPTTSERPELPIRGSSFEKTGLSGRGVRIIDDNTGQERMISSLIEEISEGNPYGR